MVRAHYGGRSPLRHHKADKRKNEKGKEEKKGDCSDAFGNATVSKKRGFGIILKTEFSEHMQDRNSTFSMVT